MWFSSPYRVVAREIVVDPGADDKVAEGMRARQRGEKVGEDDSLTLASTKSIAVSNFFSCLFKAIIRLTSSLDL